MNLSNLSLSFLEGQLKNTNPNLYNEYIKYKNSGKSPDQVINELLQSGKITQNDVNTAKQQSTNFRYNDKSF